MNTGPTLKENSAYQLAVIRHGGRVIIGAMDEETRTVIDLTEEITLQVFNDIQERRAKGQV
jgi:hypothetical protein